ncbi:hypothetical protein SB861_67690, partial [Paraburkholderia sp. SIMBA_049]
QGQRWYEVTLTGVDAHAGTTPMEFRRDTLVGAARMIAFVDALGRRHAPHARADDRAVAEVQRHVRLGACAHPVDQLRARH